MRLLVVFTLFASFLPLFPTAHAATPAPETAITSEQRTDYLSLVDEGYARLEKRNFKKAVAAFELLIERYPEVPWGYYHMACAYSQNGQTESALKYFRTAVEKGFWDLEHVTADTDMDIIRKMPEFAALEKKIQQSADAVQQSIATAFVIPDPATAQTFNSFEEFADAFGKAFFEEDQVLARVFPTSSMTAKLAIAGRYISSLRRMAQDHPDQAEDFFMKEMDIFMVLKSVAPVPISSADQEQVKRLAVFPLLFPGSAKLPEVLLTEAEVYGDLAKRSANRASSPYYAEALRRLNSIISAYPKDSAAGQSLVALIELTANHDEKVTLIKRIRNEFKDDKATNDRLWEGNRDLLLTEFGIPEFKVKDLDGHEVSPQALEGKVTLIDFWATWCKPCRAALPAIIKLSDAYGKKGLQVISVSLDIKEQLDDKAFRKFIKDHKMKWSHVYDGLGWNASMARVFHIQAIPSFILIDKEGKYVSCESHSLPAVQEIIKKLLKAN